jgi:CRISPR/Cas system-associated exonuclease Cas4 (RecB family)
MARDAHAVVAMQNARLNHGSIKWIVGRKNEDGDPLTPSPLLMRCVDGERLAQRSGELVMSFEREAPEVPPQYSLLEEGGGIQIPNPSEYPAKKSTTKVSVTAFKDYIACPYRFWLKHVMKLNIAEEGNTELDAKLFGSFIHTVLQRFGENETMKNATNPLVIERSLFDVLDCVAKDQLGPLLSGKVKIQLELAKYRLSEFAKHQAQCAIEGWSILCSEKKVRKELTIDDTSFVISGVIDRIEVHQDGRIRVLDYKTGSSTANKAHFNKDQWIDLQLPLYRILLTEIPELNDFDTSKENVSLGYFKVGDQESEIGIDILTPPEKIAETLQDTIDGTIQSIMECDYKETPTAPAPKYSDTYSWICQDNSVIEESSDDYYG